MFLECIGCHDVDRIFFADKQREAPLFPIVAQVHTNIILRRNLSLLFICAEQNIPTNETCIDNYLVIR